MRILSLLIFSAVLFILNQKTDSPHGSDFKISCKTCHSPKGWQLDKEIYSFNHNTTKMPLAGQHAVTDCRQCHKSLVFKNVKSECFECHEDVHQNSVGPDCSRCHTPASWLVSNITDIHQKSRFPLVGAHRSADCFLCHKSENLTRFDVSGTNCIDCHRENYMATSNPNHIQAGFPEDCVFCHPMTSFLWTTATFNHGIFPLSLGHANLKCTDCHKTARYTDVSTDCYSCHQQNYLSTNNPNHSASGFSTVCQNCHTLNPGWSPASFNHGSFPLTLGHSTPACADCHKNGNYTNLSSDCYSCHQANYAATTNPNHSASGISTTCATCHNTAPGWSPATFDHSAFQLTLGHSTPSCNDCHKGNYTSTSTDCYSCHVTDYNSTANPGHSALAFSTTCTQCHTTNPGWKPATYALHDAQMFPIYSGRHNGTWTLCSDCHTNPANYALFDCIRCHADAHRGSNYTNAQCYSCHPRGSSGG
jgi:hypothetical protein